MALHAVTVAFALLALGSTLYWTMLVAAGLVGILGLATQLLVNEARITTPAALVVTGSLFMVCATGLQLLPLPFSWVSTLSPAAEMHANAHAALDLARPKAVPVSMAPAETALALVRDAALCVCLFAGLIGAEQGLRSHIQHVVALSGASMAVLALGHQLAGATEVYGMYRPRYANPSILSPLLNANHLAGLMVLTVPIMLERAFRASAARKRWSWTSLAACGAVVCALTYSRGGLASLAIGIALVTARALWTRRWWSPHRPRRSAPVQTRHHVLPTTTVLCCLVAAAVFAATSGEAEHRLATGTEKLRKVGEALEFAISVPFPGLGRGAFSSVLAMTTEDHARRMTHPENLLAQWCSDWGVALAALWLGTLTWWAYRTGKHLLQSHSLRNVGTYVGLVCLALHNMFDFSLEILGVGVPATLAMGTIAGLPGGAAHRVPRWSATILGLGLLGITIGVWQWPIAKPTYYLARRMADPAFDEEEFQTLLVRASLGHPTEPSFALLAARRARARSSQDVPLWLNRSMRLAPGWAAPHLETADWLLGRDLTRQAILELRSAASLDPEATSRFLCESLHTRPDAKELAVGAIPRGSRGTAYLERLASCLPWSSPILPLADERLLERDSDHLGATVRTARRLRKDGEPRAALARLLPLHDPEAPNRDLVRELVSCLLAVDRAHEARDLLGDLKLERRPQLERGLYPSIVSVAYALDEPQRGRAALRSWRRTLGANQSAALAETFELEGWLSERAGDHRSALAAYERAYRLTRSDSILRRIVRAAMLQGKDRRVEELCQALSGPLPPACAEAAAKGSGKAGQLTSHPRVQAAPRPGGE